MNNLILLNSYLSKARSRALRRLSELSPADAIYLETWKAFLELSDQTPVHSLELSELPFDRLLLEHSQCYRTTRRLAKIFGFKIQPSAISSRRAFEEFSPFQDRVFYTPSSSAYLWVLKQPNPGRSLVLQIEELNSYNNSIYHDLNQMVLVRLLHPIFPDKKSSSVLLYHYLLESLTQIRDVQLAEELGPCASIFKRSLLAYSAFKADFPYQPALSSLDSFRTLLISYYFQMRDGVSVQRKLKNAFNRARKPLTTHPLFGLSQIFVEEISSSWIKKNGDFMCPTVWPKPPKSLRRLVYDLAIPTPEKILKDDRLISDLYIWFQHIFEK